MPTERRAWLALGIGLLLWALGQTYYSVVLYYAEPAPFPSPADALFLAFYPASFVALVLLLRARVAHLEPLAWVDALIGALAVAAVAAALIFPPVLEALGGSPLGVAVSLAYPCMDLVLLGLLSGAFVLSRWRSAGSLLLIAAALLLFGACDVVYLSAAGQSTTGLNAASVGWPLAFLLLALASWLPATEVGAAVGAATRRRIAVPLAMALVGIALLVAASFVAVDPTAVALGAACLVAVLARLLITFNQNTGMLVASEEEALTDDLTGLANRRSLMADLERVAAASPPESRVLALYDLDGFKAYNDSFGHPAGDDLLRRLGKQLAASMAPYGRAYRLGGDEFCILAATRALSAETICEAAEEALSERGTRLLDRRLLGQGPDPGRGRHRRPTRCVSPTAGCTRKRAAAPIRSAARPAASCCGCCTSASRSWSATSTGSPTSPPPSAVSSASTPRRSTSSSAPPSCTTSARSRSPTRSSTSAAS